jgi:hypothetical protein
MSKLVGLKIKLDRLVDRERPCCRNVCIITAVDEFTCADCGQHRGCSNPEAIAEGARNKNIHIGRRRQRRYSAVEIMNLSEEAPPAE